MIESTEDSGGEFIVPRVSFGINLRRPTAGTAQELNLTSKVTDLAADIKPRASTSNTQVTASKACKEAFLQIIEPELLSWNLRRHPNSFCCYGGADHGYRWDFADTRDPLDVRLVAFSIINPGQHLVIEGLRGLAIGPVSNELPLVHSNSANVFRVTRKWSIKRPLTGLIFRFETRRNMTITTAALALMTEVKERLPKLRTHLYG